jgi:hypothetical protein
MVLDSRDALHFLKTNDEHMPWSVVRAASAFYQRQARAHDVDLEPQGDIPPRITYSDIYLDIRHSVTSF